MTNTSATGGYLAPDTVYPAPLEDDALDDFMGDVVAALTTLDRDTAVRPRWQAEPPDLPPFGTDWAAVGVPERTRDTYAAIIHEVDVQTGDGADTMIRHEQLRVLVSFYGPRCQTLAMLFADGLMVPQNREALGLAGFSLREVGEPTKAPEMIKNRWTPRCDLAAWLSREVRRQYPVLSILSAETVLNGGPITVTIDVGLPSSLDFSDPDNSGLLPGL